MHKQMLSIEVAAAVMRFQAIEIKEKYIFKGW